MRLSAGKVEPRWLAADGMEAARSRQATYRLLAAMFLYPSHDRLERLRALARELSEEEDATAEIAVSPGPGRLLNRLRSLADLQMEEEYNALFSVKPKAPPYESVYVDPEGFNGGWIGVSLERIYGAAGVGVSENHKETPDHVAVELEFMAYLCSLEAQALAERDMTATARARQYQAAFLNQHLGLWFAPFAQRVREASPGSHYDAVADAADSFVAQELGSLGAGAPPSKPRIPRNGRAELLEGEATTSTGFPG
ncbi:MAG: molecular chaperone TorD family protein [Anaerolineae bacterium]|nr:MAG: molecular chaperone TorD family protein [Anaerolineae bacterium]